MQNVLFFLQNAIARPQKDTNKKKPPLSNNIKRVKPFFARLFNAKIAPYATRFLTEGTRKLLDIKENQHKI